MSVTPALQPEPRLAIRTLLVYCSPNVGVAFLYLLMIVMYLKFATEELGISPAVLGGIFFVSKAWDAVTDPMAGYLSDRTTSRLGRRRSWMLVSAPLILLFSVMAWVPPSGLSQTALTAWVAVAVFGFYTAFTIYEVPNTALGAELTQHHDDRNRVFGGRQAARALGQLLAFIVGAAILQGAEDRLSAAAWLIGTVSVLTLLWVVWSVWQLPAERSDYTGRGAGNPLEAVRDVWSNPHARIVLFVFFIDYLGAGGVATVAPFVAQYVLGAPKLLPIVLGAYSVFALVSIPGWIWLGNRFEKQRVWRVAMVLAGVGFGGLLFVEEGTALLMTASFGLAGIGHGCGPVLGQSLKADIIDYDELQTGERKEGSYFAAWNFVHKLAIGLMVGLAGVSLDWAGFVPNAAQSDTVKTVMLVLIGGIPLVCYAIGLAVFARFDLTRADHAAILRAIDQRASTGSSG